MRWLGCTACGKVWKFVPSCHSAEPTEAPSGCDGPFRLLDSVAEKLEFKLTMAERADEAAAVARAAEAMKR